MIETHKCSKCGKELFKYKIDKSDFILGIRIGLSDNPDKMVKINEYKKYKRKYYCEECLEKIIKRG